VNRELTEELRGAQWLENRPVKLIRKVHLTFRAVVETQPYRVTTNATGLNGLRQHGNYSRGSNSRQWFARLLQYGDGDISGDARKVIEELIERFSSFKIVKQILHRDPGTGEYRDAALNAPVDSDEVLAHSAVIRQLQPAVANQTKLTGPPR
jgi:hypothetical protein